MKALILAGGKGTRLSALTRDVIPKPMVRLLNKPLMQYAVERLRENGITDIYVSVGHLHECIQEYFGDGSKFGVKLKYIVESEPLGSGGAIYFLKDEVRENLLVCPADAIFDVDFARMEAYHKSKNSYITLFVHPNLHPYDSDLVVMENGRVTAFHYKNQPRDFYYSNCVNAGILIASPETFDFFDCVKAVNMEKDYVTHFIPQGKVYGYKSTEYVKDVGTPERFKLAEQDVLSGVVSAKNLRNKQKAVFLDRDGTINKYKGFITSADDIELLPQVAEAVKKLNSSKYLAIVISNQPVIARGEATFEEVNKMFNKIETLLGKEGAYLDGIFYCPHHPHKGFTGEVPELKIQCDCRKPNTGLLKQAQEAFNLQLSDCVMVGDSNVDVLTAQNAGIAAIKIDGGVEEETDFPDCTKAVNLLDAVNKILEQER